MSGPFIFPAQKDTIGLTVAEFIASAGDIQFKQKLSRIRSGRVNASHSSYKPVKVLFHIPPLCVA